jgi:DMATS type aromatic prenyltransferase
MLLAMFTTYSFHPFRKFISLVSSHRSTCSDIPPWSYDSEIPSDDRVWMTVRDTVCSKMEGAQFAWFNTSGLVLAFLLHYSDYPPPVQFKALEFYARVVIPSLGNGQTRSLYSSDFHSFMTDDGNPVELSWDWGENCNRPSIRYSIEPIGLNWSGKRPSATRFNQILKRQLPSARFEWFDHFESTLFGGKYTNTLSADGHMSHIFYAFDLNELNTVVKAYFLPAGSARARGQSPWQTIRSAIVAAPQCNSSNLKALEVLDDFFSHPQNSCLEVEMLAIDLVDPQDSRIKVYFRSRKTDFCTVKDILALNRREFAAKNITGIEALRTLWGEVFPQSFESPGMLRSNSHRTAGILYYADFRLGSQLPSVKLYVPMRHYCRNDADVLNSVEKIVRATGETRYLRNYKTAIHRAL